MRIFLILFEINFIYLNPYKKYVYNDPEINSLQNW